MAGLETLSFAALPQSKGRLMISINLPETITD